MDQSSTTELARGEVLHGLAYLPSEESLRAALQDVVEPVYDHHGCGGCQGTFDDYCRCGYYTGEVELPTQRQFLVGLLATERALTHQRVKLSSPETAVLGELAAHYGLFESDNYEAEGEGDYYGEILLRVIVRADLAGFIQELARLRDVFLAHSAE